MLFNIFSIVEDTSTGIVTLDKEIVYKEIKAEKYLLLPGQFMLATTMEYISLLNELTAFIQKIILSIFEINETGRIEKNGWGK